jgi:hypothetical protein
MGQTGRESEALVFQRKLSMVSGPMAVMMNKMGRDLHDQHGAVDCHDERRRGPVRAAQ